MTMKKIGLSALVAATLTTGAFATGTLTFDEISFNTKYLGALSSDKNITTANNGNDHIGYRPSGDINSTSYLILDLSDGAKFVGEASDWKLLQAGNEMGSGNNFYNDNTRLLIKVTEDITASDYNITDTIADDGNYTIALNKGFDKDVTLKITSVDSVNANGNPDTVDNIVGRVDATKIFTASTIDVKGSLVCSDRIYINSDDKTIFETTSAPDEVINDKNVTCEFKVIAPTTKNIDFDYSDVNVTLEFTGGNFTEGNLTKSANKSSSNVPDRTVLNKTATGYTYVFDTAKELNASSNLEQTITYSLDPATNDLKSVTFGHTAKLQFLGDNNPDVSFNIIEDGSVDMAWTLATYTGTVTGVADFPSINMSTNIRVFNNTDLTTGKIIKPEIKVITKDGIDLGKKIYDKDLNPGSNYVIKAKDIRDSKMFGEEAGNGFKVIVSLDIPSKKGDMEVMDTRANGISYKRVIDNNPDNDPSGTTK